MRIMMNEFWMTHGQKKKKKKTVMKDYGGAKLGRRNKHTRASITWCTSSHERLKQPP